MSATADEYSLFLEQLRDAIGKGTPDKVDLVLGIRVIKDSVTRMGTTPTDIDDQFDILDAFTDSDDAATIVAAIATASGVLRADSTAIGTVPTLIPGGLVDG